MNLKRSLSPRLVLLALLCFMLPGTLRADNFTFSFTNTTGNTAGTVTGEILGLTNNTTSTGIATVILTSYPAVFSVFPQLSSPPITVFYQPGVWIASDDTFTETNGVITFASFDAQTPDLSFARFALGTCNCSPPAVSFLELSSATGPNPLLIGTVTYSPAPAVPEPPTLSLMLIGVGSLGLVMEMRKRLAKGLPIAT
jgi:hypothetical protein